MQEMQICSLDWEDPPKEERATHSSSLAWKILWTDLSKILWTIAGYFQWGNKRVKHNLATKQHEGTILINIAVKSLLERTFTIKNEFEMLRDFVNISWTFRTWPWALGRRERGKVSSVHSKEYWHKLTAERVIGETSAFGFSSSALTEDQRIWKEEHLSWS